MKTLNVFKIPGFLDYETGLELQKTALNLRKEGGNDNLLLLEHKPVFTLGKGTEGLEREKLFKKSISEIEAEGIGIYDTKRGGHITYHAPGQLVAYPFFPVKFKEFGTFCANLEQIMFRIAEHYDVPLEIKGEKQEDPRDGKMKRLFGVWYQEKSKVGAIGIEIRDGISTHGFALNVDLNLSPFGYIDPCGLKGYDASSFSSITNREFFMDEIKHVTVKKFVETFGYSHINYCAPDSLKEVACQR